MATGGGAALDTLSAEDFDLCLQTGCGLCRWRWTLCAARLCLCQRPGTCPCPRGFGPLTPPPPEKETASAAARARASRTECTQESGRGRRSGAPCAGSGEKREWMARDRRERLLIPRLLKAGSYRGPLRLLRWRRIFSTKRAGCLLLQALHGHVPYVHRVCCAALTVLIRVLCVLCVLPHHHSRHHEYCRHHRHYRHDQHSA